MVVRRPADFGGSAKPDVYFAWHLHGNEDGGFEFFKRVRQARPEQPICTTRAGGYGGQKATEDLERACGNR